MFSVGPPTLRFRSASFRAHPSAGQMFSVGIPALRFSFRFVPSPPKCIPGVRSCLRRPMLDHVSCFTQPPSRPKVTDLFQSIWEYGRVALSVVPPWVPEALYPPEFPKHCLERTSRETTGGIAAPPVICTTGALLDTP